MAVGTAYGWLADPHAAEDAAQEAFLEVYLNLDRLREPAAFPGFLRAVVRKRCDRRTRSPRRETTLEESALETAGGADAIVEAREARTRLRAAVEELPAHERVVVALHYLAGLSEAQVADALELPRSTVKKRLHSSRARLRGGFDLMVEETLSALRPSRTTGFSDTIQLFLAIRTGDALTVGRLLDANPALVEADERWEPELTRAHALPAVAGGTPLVRAAERDRAELVDLLLDRGAAIDRSCSCAGGESPLWAAAAAGSLEAASRLLARGADPDRPSFAGHTPLHVAAIRHDAALVELLLAHGADLELRDARGRTALDWAIAKGRAVVALLGAQDAPARRGDSSPVNVGLTTGIRALDLFAPMLPGARIQLRFDPGLGAVVLVGELSAGFARRAGRPATVWAGWEHHPVDRSEFEHAFAELGLGHETRLVWSNATENEAERQRLPGRAFDEAERLRAQDARDVLVVIWSRPGRAAEIEAVLPRAAATEAGSITVLVAERDGDPAADDVAPSPPWDARWVLDPALARLRYFPAVDPLRTTSRLAESAQVAEARRLLACLRDAAPDLQPSNPDDAVLRRALRLQAWLAQPFHTTEAFTGEPGATTTPEVLEDDLGRLLAGDADRLPVQALLYKQNLAAALER